MLTFVALASNPIYSAVAYTRQHTGSSIVTWRVAYSCKKRVRFCQYSRLILEYYGLEDFSGNHVRHTDVSQLFMTLIQKLFPSGGHCLRQYKSVHISIGIIIWLDCFLALAPSISYWGKEMFLSYLATLFTCTPCPASRANTDICCCTMASIFARWIAGGCAWYDKTQS